MEVITARPKGMSYKEYRVLRSENKRKIKRYLKEGRTYYVSWEHTYVDVAGVAKQVMQKFPPFVGSVKRDLVKPV